MWINFSHREISIQVAGTLKVETSSPLSHPLILSSSQMLNCVKGMVDLVMKMLSYGNSYVIRFLAWDILKSLTRRKSSINSSSTARGSHANTVKANNCGYVLLQEDPPYRLHPLFGAPRFNPVCPLYVRSWLTFYNTVNLKWNNCLFSEGVIN